MELLYANPLSACSLFRFSFACKYWGEVLRSGFRIKNVFAPMDFQLFREISNWSKYYSF